MNKCVFCQIYKNNQDILKRYNYFFINPDKYPVNFGHFEIIPVRHVASITELNDVEWGELSTIIKNIRNDYKTYDFESFYQKIIKQDLDKKAVDFCLNALNTINGKQQLKDFNLGINEGRLAGRTIDHLHIHIIPRYKGDCVDPTGGVRSVIYEKMNYKK